ncbi:MAG: 16S rRNA (cytosine(1402)-N(4))-methyltransferase RsmH [Endomicrobium sp.]|jgi:16S rRNA (cytosine1402-N4)-methyltransferase|nr:16S rRNA (cytosine(1402)-N(4))-methyltransferase RsmH [Endomicrobium sp.]
MFYEHIHIPVMLSEISKYLIQNIYGVYVDCTFGNGGHTFYLLNKFKNIKIIAIDWDEQSLYRFNENKFNDRVIFIRDNFKNIKQILSNLHIDKVDGILADIGISSQQLNDLSRGFSFKSPRLDMRMDNRLKITAQTIINSTSANNLANIFYRYGEEYQSRKIANSICIHRKQKCINSAKELQNIVCAAKTRKRLNRRRRRTKIHTATKVFQALRIVVNSELDNLQQLLSIAPELLNCTGRVVIVSFHSLEDRMVKLNFKHNTCNGIYKTITKKVIKVSKDELNNNFRVRSARMRVAEKQ